MLHCKSHFFQPILPGFENGFSIPVSFFKHLKGKACEEVVLRSLAGKLWQVKINGRRLEDGWKEFAKYHALRVGDFLVFRYEGNMVFDVMVFDPSTCEREYSSFEVKEETATSEQQEKLAKKSDLRDLTNNKQIMITGEGKSVHPELENPRLLNIPKKFARENGLCNRNCKVVLEDQEGRSWLADLGHKKSDGSVFVKNGWRAFCLANDLKAGDSFIFELIQEGTKPIIKMSRLNSSLKTKQRRSSSTRNDQFSIILKASCIKKSQLKIPRDFARKHNIPNRKHAKMILTNERGSSWLASLTNNGGNGDVYVGRGWRPFAAANGLREGDELMLELIKRGEKPVMRIYGTKQATK